MRGRSRSRRRKRKIQIAIMMLSLVSLGIVVGLSYMEANPMIAKAVTIEAGTPTVDVNRFMLKDAKSVSFVTDINKLDLNMPGVYEIQIQVNGRVHASNLEIVDTIAPRADSVEVIALKDERVRALDFVDNIVDATDVKVSFIDEPDTSTPGEKVVKIAVVDSGKNHIVVESKLTVLDVKSSVKVEAGGVLDVKPADFVDNNNIEVKILSDISGLDISKPTEHPVSIEVDGRILNSYIHVVDTTPPTATPVNVEVWLGESLPPSSFVKDIKDISHTEIFFATETKFDEVGSHEIGIIIEDIYGNKSEIKSILKVKADTEPPVFSGIVDKTVIEGETISYKKGVSVRDNKDKDVTYQIDSSKVNLNKVGTYTVTYTAKDSSGNKAVKTATITVRPFVVTEEMLYDKVDPIIAKITKANMSKREIAYEIYKWVKANVGYTGSSNKDDWKKEAYNGLEKGRGDCFTFYAVAEALLTRAGIDNMRVTRVGGKTRHYWNLINCGDGWYHFDTCPNKDKMETFMLTDAEVEAYTKKRGNNYYNFDKSLYPATPEK
ncbi:MAG: DUF5011 domain-containing protein [Clostridiales bacterium]|nr:DUF5011 domain-containing protein [Clostridiales bacterium]